MRLSHPLLKPYLVVLSIFGLIFGAFPTHTSANYTAIASPCDTIAAFPVDAQPFATVQCQTYETTFGDGLPPSMVYKFDTLLEKNGAFQGTDAYGRAVSFEAVSVVQVPLRKLRPESFAEGDEASLCYGYFIGPNGKAPVAALSIKKPSLTQSPNCSIVMILETLTAADLALVEQVERVMAGAMIYNTSNGKSMSLSQATNSGTNFMLSISPSDLATLNGTIAQPWQAGVPLTCVQVAYQTFRANEDFARRGINDCMVNVVAVFAACMAGCAGAAFFTLIVAPAAMALCAGGCLAAQAIGIAYCIRSFNSQRRLNLDTLRIALAGCGVYILEV